MGPPRNDMVLSPMKGMSVPHNCSLGSYLLPEDALMARLWHFGTLALIPVHFSLSLSPSLSLSLSPLRPFLSPPPPPPPPLSFHHLSLFVSAFPLNLSIYLCPCSVNVLIYLSNQIIKFMHGAYVSTVGTCYKKNFLLKETVAEKDI